MKNRDLTTEQWIAQWLSESDAEIRPEEIALESINYKRAVVDQNRTSDSLNEEHLEHIVEWLGDPAHTVSPIVVNRVGAVHYIIDGNHRAAACLKVGRPTIDAYVLTVPPETFAGMTLSANARSGLTLTPAERTELAIKAAEIYGAPVAAAQFLMTPDQLNKARRTQSGRLKFYAATRGDTRNLTDTKADIVNRLDEAQLEKLGADNILRATAAELEQSARNILAVPAASRHEQAIKESQRLVMVHERKKTPAGTRAVRRTTSTTIRNKVNEVIKYLRDNPAAFNDDALMAALSTLVREVTPRARESAESAA